MRCARPIAGTLIALVFAWGCATTAAETAATGRWYEVRSPRFLVWTDGRPEHAQHLVQDLERFHQVMLAKTTAEERSAAPPLKIFLAKDHASYVAWTGNARQSGVFVATSRGNYALATTRESGGEGSWDSRDVLFHEYTHYMMATQGAIVPSWYNEGFAQYMETTRFRDDGSYTLGCPHSAAGTLAQLRWLPIGRVMEADDIESGPADAPFSREASQAAYLESWYAVHFFTAQSELQQQLQEYLRLWSAKQTPPDQAFARAFGLTYAQFDALLQKYAKQAKLECVAIQPAQVFAVPRVDVRPLSRAEAHLHLGDLLLAKFGPTEAAVDLLQKAAAEAGPGDFKPIAALARARLTTAQTAQGEAARSALQEAERLLERAKSSPAAATDAETLAIEGHILRVEAERLTASGDEAAEDVLKRSRVAYRKAIRSDETIAEAYQGLGATYLIADNGSQEPQVVLEAAAFLLPLDPNVAWTLAQLHVARGNALQAIPALEHVLRWCKEEADRVKVRAAIDELRRTAGAGSVEAAKPDGAAAADAPATSSPAPDAATTP